MLNCWTGIEFLKFLQDIRLSLPRGVTDFMIFVSSITFYMALPIIICFIMFLFIDKRKAEFCMLNITTAYMINSLLKFIIREPRPYDLDKSITPASKESSYSTPSAHAAMSTASYGSFAWVFRNKIVRIVSIAILTLIVFSRMYLGVHTPLDIILGIFITVAVMIVNWCLLEISYQSDRNYYIIDICYLVFFIAVMICIELTINKHYANLSLCSGLIFGLLVARLIEHRYIKYEIPKCQTKNKIILGTIGIVVIVLIIGAVYVTKIHEVLITGGFVTMIWAYAVFPYLVKNRVSIFGRLIDD